MVIPYDPCGRIVDWYSKPYFAWVHPFRDSTIEAKIEWYPARDDAEVLPYDSVFCNLDQQRMDQVLPIFCGYDVGEIPFTPRPRSFAKAPTRPNGPRVCGTADDFENGAVYDPTLEAEPRDADGMPICCRDDVGGILWSGSVFVGISGGIEWSGGFEFTPVTFDYPFFSAPTISAASGEVYIGTGGDPQFAYLQVADIVPGATYRLDAFVTDPDFQLVFRGGPAPPGFPPAWQLILPNGTQSRSGTVTTTTDTLVTALIGVSDGSTHWPPIYFRITPL